MSARSVDGPQRGCRRGFTLVELLLAIGLLSILVIRYIGLATAQPAWSAITILTSFAWGMLYFDEHVASWQQAIDAKLRDEVAALRGRG